MLLVISVYNFLVKVVIKIWVYSGNLTFSFYCKHLLQCVAVKADDAFDT